MSDTPHTPAFHPLAASLAFLFPGLGHYALGHTRRALAIAAGILSLFLGGILIGGIDVIDRKEDTVWFAGQACVGPLAFAVDYLHQSRFKVHDTRAVRGPDGRAVQATILRSAHPNEGRDAQGNPVPGGTPPNRKSIGKVNELGTLFATIAGMINLIAIIDAAWPTHRRETLP